MANRPMPMIIF